MAPRLRHSTAASGGQRRPAHAAHAAPDWGSLRLELLERIFDQLCQLQPLLSVPQVARLRAALAVNRQWWQAARQLRLPAVRCTLFSGELPRLLALAAQGVAVEQLWLQNGCGEVVQQAFEHICEQEDRQACWSQLTSGARLLAGLPARLDVAAVLHSCSSRLRALHLHLSTSMREATVGGEGWQQLTALRELQVTGEPRTELAIDRLPPALVHLTASAGAMSITLPVLLAVPAASLAAEQIFLVENIQGEDGNLDAPTCQLHILLEAVMSAGMPRGHAFKLGAQAIWFRRVGRQEAWLRATDPSLQPTVDLGLGPHHLNQLHRPPPVPKVRVERETGTGRTYQFFPRPPEPEDAELHPLLPQPPAEVQTVFTAVEGSSGWYRTAQYDNLTANQERRRPTWPLELGSSDELREPAMLVSIDSKDPHRFVADTESEDEVDPDSDIPMSQRLTARDTFREMARLPSEYPPGPEPYNPDKHRTVDELVSDADEMLPDDPVGLDEELITGAVGNRPTEGGTAMSVGGPWPGPAGDREQRKAEAEAEATDMKHGAGQKQSSEGGSEVGSSGGAEGEFIVPEGGPAAAKGGCVQLSAPGQLAASETSPSPGAAKAQAATRAAAAAKSLQQEGGSGLSEGGPGMADRLVAEAAAQRMEGREEAGSEKGPAATGSGGGTGDSSTGGQAHATSRATSAQDVGGASGAAGSVEKEAAAQGKESTGAGEEDEELPGWGGSGTREDRRARRRAMEQMGGGDRPERVGLTLFLDKEQRE
ncbi:hypothetical protein C2E21_5620 isoform B [Chlorella sorokiniana]|uniref:Uncharacterized protein n=1 Tax=Chlorella sorokiniana TaxID=3076 RepID=A0A2P6TP73_CHLSO|nr:hypothetical protein C2E21_5620 isoform B [Chlorella sorokiniana]|eukprot:PRW51135.1 hypothetical protein C2E21_5620 isoform B [Chlorella sorokiniana]